MEGRNQLRSSSNNLAWARVTVMEIKGVCFRGKRDGVWDELNMEDNRERGIKGNPQIFV